MLGLLTLSVAAVLAIGLISASLLVSYTRGTQGVSTTQTIANAAASDVEDTIATGTVNGEYDLTWVAARIKLLLMVSDQNLTIKTNSTGSPDNTFTLLAGVPFLWYVGIGSACPVTADVTKIYVSNSSGNSANLQIRSISDPTP